MVFGQAGSDLFWNGLISQESWERRWTEGTVSGLCVFRESLFGT